MMVTATAFMHWDPFCGHITVTVVSSVVRYYGMCRRGEVAPATPAGRARAVAGR